MWSIGSSPIPRTAAEEAYFSHWLGIGIRCWRTEAGLLIYYNSNKQSNICKPPSCFWCTEYTTRPGDLDLLQHGWDLLSKRTQSDHHVPYLPTATGERDRASTSSAPGELAAAAGAVSPKLDNDVDPFSSDLTHLARSEICTRLLDQCEQVCPTGPFIMLALDRLQPSSPDRFLSLHDSQRCPSSLHLNASTSNVSAQCWTHRSISVDLIGI